MASEAWKAWAVPVKLPWMVAGRPISCWALSMAVDGVAQRTPGGRLNEIVTEGNWPWWLTDSGGVAALDSA